jgi:hypothetical protein
MDFYGFYENFKKLIKITLSYKKNIKKYKNFIKYNKKVLEI